jgi:hypothetical protein
MNTTPASNGAVNRDDATPTNGKPSNLDLPGYQPGECSACDLAEACINPPADLPDHHPDEAPELEHDLAEAALVFAAMDARQHLDLSQCLTLDELIERQVEFYEGWQNEAGKMFALHMTELLIKYRSAGSASTPAEATARIEILEQDVRQDWEARGYDAGFDAGCRQAMPYNGPLD